MVNIHFRFITGWRDKEVSEHFYHLHYYTRCLLGGVLVLLPQWQSRNCKFFFPPQLCLFTLMWRSDTSRCFPALRKEWYLFLFLPAVAWGVLPLLTITPPKVSLDPYLCQPRGVKGYFLFGSLWQYRLFLNMFLCQLWPDLSETTDISLALPHSQEVMFSTHVLGEGHKFIFEQTNKPKKS